jgi:alpha-2-macroglobulin
VRVEGGLKVTGAKSQSVSLSPKGNGRAVFGIVADNTSGVAKIIVEAKGMDNVKDETEIAIRPTSPLDKKDGGGTLPAGKTTKITIPGGYITSTQKSSIVISRFPATQYAEQLNQLVGYPHGCLEQTTSKLFPQLYFEDLAAAVDKEVKPNGNPVYFVNEGIRKIQGLAMGDGSLSMWPGGNYSNDWASVYAIHFLVEAKKAGYDVNDRVLKSCHNYLSRLAAHKGTYSYRTYSVTGEKVEVKAYKEEIYALYVLALAGKPDMGMMNYYRSRPHLLTGDSRYLLGGAFGHANNWAAFNELLPSTFKPETPERQDGGCYDSEIRANAIMLAVLADVDPNHKQVQPLITYLSKNAKSAWSTQDRAWLFLALGKAAKGVANSNVKVDVMVDGKSLGTFDGTRTLTVRSSAVNGKSISLNATGTGSAYYYWGTQGVVAAPYAVKEEDMNLTVRRTFYTRGGVQVTDNTFEQGDLVVCKITLTTGIRSIDNLAISDLLPAGFEIDNPRLSSSTSLNWVSSNLYPQYMDIRDDRLLLYANLPKGGERSYYYLCRVVNAGHFRLAPVGAEAMYDQMCHSTNGAGWVTVRPKAKPGV